MLVLTRRPDESIVIDGNIQVRVLGVQGNKVRLGIEAPDNITVDREEIHQRRSEFGSAFNSTESAQGHPERMEWSEMVSHCTDYY